MTTCRTHTTQLACIVILAGSMAVGCEKRKVETASTFAEADDGPQLTIVLDLSNSCAELMANDGPGYAFTLQLVDKFFRASGGSRDRIILAQLSANSEPLWAGSPLELRKRFDPESLAHFLRSKADPNGSAVYVGVTRALEYAMSHQANSKRAKNTVVVLSDLVDTSSDRSAARAMLDTVAKFSSKGGAIAFYYVDQTVAGFLREHLEEIGVDDYRVETEIVAAPPLPSFD